MDCRDFEERLEELLDGTLPAADEESCARHLERCSRCRELVEPLRAEVAPPADLLASVLTRTSGPACGQARDLLCGWVDAVLPAAERQLVAGHLAGCSDCAALAAALAELARDLPRLAELRPAPGFVEAVLAATVPVHRRLRRWWRRSWEQWVWRPRFASETAFVATLALVLVLATPGSPLEAVPGRALELARTDPVAALEAPASAAGEHISSRLEKLRLAAVSRLESTSREVTAVTQGRLARLRERLAAAAGTLRERAASLLERAEREPSDEEPASAPNDPSEETP